MKIVAILGTPHGSKGATGHLLRKVIAPLEAAGVQVQLFEVHKMNIEPCRGCSVCHKKGTASSMTTSTRSSKPCWRRTV